MVGTRRSSAGKQGKKSAPSAQKSANKELEKLKRELEEQKRKNQEQESKIQALSTKKTKKQMLGKLTISSEIEDKVKDLAGMLGPKLWRTTKFINNKHQEREACKIVMESLHEMKPLLEGDDQAQIDDNIDAFMDTYGGTVCKSINDARSNAQSGMKKAYLEFAAANPKFKMPSAKELMAVIRRKKEDLVFSPEAQKPQAPDPETFQGGENSEEFKALLAGYQEDQKKWKEEQARINRNRKIFQRY